MAVTMCQCYWMYMRVQLMCARYPWRPQEASGPLELRTVVSSSVHAGNGARIFCKCSKRSHPLSHFSSSDNGCFYAKCRFFFQSLSERLEPLNYVTCLSSKMPTMEWERGQPGVLRAGHTTFSSLGAEALVTSHPLTRSRAPFVEDTWGARGPACHPVENPPPYP